MTRIIIFQQGSGGIIVLLLRLIILIGICVGIVILIKRFTNSPHVSSLMNNRKTLGIIIAIIGVTLIVISPSLLWQKSYASFDWRNPGVRTETLDLRGITLFFGAALLIVGGIVSAIGFSQSTSTQPVVTQSVSPKSVELGNTPDEVQSVMGQPDKIINLGARKIHIYKDMKITYVNGKVSDVQLS